ncbi:MAG: hypothetical protein ACR2OI_07980 [Acidimicrobiia bacterium]
MLIESQSTKSLNQDRSQRLRSSSLRRPDKSSHPVRLAMANTLIGWARRLAPELPEARVLRTRAAPN